MAPRSERAGRLCPASLSEKPAHMAPGAWQASTVRSDRTDYLCRITFSIFLPIEFMARSKSEWPNKVLALIQGGNVPAAIAQIKVAPTVADVTRLQTLLTKLPASPALEQLRKVVEEERALLAAPRLHRAP
jgi:hypothetical protein